MSERYVDVVPTRQRQLAKLLGCDHAVLYAGRREPRRMGVEIGATQQPQGRHGPCAYRDAA